MLLAPAIGRIPPSLLVLSRKPHSKWYRLFCACGKSYKRKDGSCPHTRAFLDQLPELMRPRWKVAQHERPTATSRAAVLLSKPQRSNQRTPDRGKGLFCSLNAQGRFAGAAPSG